MTQTPKLLQNKLDNTIQKYLDIPNVENININKPKEVYFEIAGGIREKADDENLTRVKLEDLANTIAAYNGIIWSPDKETLSAKLPDGTRVEVFQTPAVISGFSMSLRKRKNSVFSFSDFGVTKEQEDMLIKAVKSRKSILVSGGTSSGKTTFLEILCKSIPSDTRLITIQDPMEIEFDQQNRIDLTVTTTDIQERSKQLSDICNTALRQNPDSIIFGEIREKTMAFTYRVASNTGHDGCMATIHANNPDAAIKRLVNLVHSHEGGLKDPIEQEILDCTNIIIQLTKARNGTRKAEIKVLT